MNNLFIAPRGQRESVFVGLKVATLFLGLRDEITTPLVVGSSFGVSQLIFYNTANGLNIAFIRIYNFFNHFGSKVFKEYKIGNVNDCNTLSSSPDRPTMIALICGSRLTVLDINLNPRLLIMTDGRNQSLDLTLESSNQFSTSKFRVLVRNTNIDSDVSPWLVLLMFLCIILVSVAIFHSLINMKLMCRRNKKDLSLSSRNRLSKNFNTPEYLQPPVKNDKNGDGSNEESIQTQQSSQECSEYTICNPTH